MFRSTCLAVSLGTWALTAGAAEVITFEGLPPGTIVTTINVPNIGTVEVFGANPDFPGINHAVIFDTNAPTGGDVDLGSPNETCGGPGISNDGAGEVGGAHPNCLMPNGPLSALLNNVLIVAEDLIDGNGDGLVDDPDDEDTDGRLIFIFPIPVTFESITLLDIQADEDEEADVRLFADPEGTMELIASPVELTDVGDNGVAIFEFDPDIFQFRSVRRMSVRLKGSGAIDNIVICVCDDDDPCTTDMCNMEGECISTPIDCSDDDLCTVDSCNSDTGECVHEPFECSDGNACTADYCLDGECFHEQIDCNDMDPCTVDSCVDGECTHEAIDCDDDDACTTDACVDGMCVNTPIDCDDEDPCTDDYCDDGECFNPDNGECGLECRVTGGGNGEFDGHAYTFGGQAGAPTAAQPQPYGEWTHHERQGPNGQKFVFHAGTASAPDATEIDLIVCSDPGSCHPARPAPAKQIDFEGVGTFKNLHNASAALSGVVSGVTLHWFEVHIEDLGEPGTASDRHGNARLSRGRPGGAIERHTFAGQDAAEGCPPMGHAGELADCGCPDFYHITIYAGVMPGEPLNTSDVIYEVYNYFNGNLQIHPPVGH